MELEGMIQAWRVNNRINVELLRLVPDQALDLKPGKGKTIRSNFTHIVGVRKMWVAELLKKSGGDFSAPDWKQATRGELESALAVSSGWMEKLFESRAEKASGAWPLPLFYSYCIAHEAYHRSQVEIALRLGGHELDDKSAYGLWEWNKFGDGK